MDSKPNLQKSQLKVSSHFNTDDTSQNCVGYKKMQILLTLCDPSGQLLQVSGSEQKQLKRLQYIEKKLKKMEKCEHNERKYKARLQCNSCYLSIGNQARATECMHLNRTHHSRGLCKKCYQKIYNKFLSNPNARPDQVKLIIDEEDVGQLEHSKTYRKYIDIKNGSKKQRINQDIQQTK